VLPNAAARERGTIPAFALDPRYPSASSEQTVDVDTCRLGGAVGRVRGR
jgi:hypothetical protein